MMREALLYIPALLTWSAVAYLAPRRHRGPDDGSKDTLWAGLLFLALAVTILLPPVSLAIDRLSHIANVTRLLGHAFVLVAAWAVQVYLLQLNFPDEWGRWKIRRRISALAGTLAFLLMFFVLAPVHKEASDFWGRYGSAPFVLPYRLVFVGYLGWALVTVVRLSWRYAGITDHPATALGLRVVVLGAIVSLGYCLHEGLRVIASAFGLANPLLDSNTVTQALVAGGVGLLAVGATMPAWGPRARIPELVAWVRCYRAHQRLYGLWRDLYEAIPSIALFPPPSSRLDDMLTVRDLQFRLYRRVVEIRDGILALRPYCDPDAPASALKRCQAAGVDGETEIVVEAASLAVALDARRSGRPGDPRAAPTSSVAGADLSSEVLVLERLARCYARSPIVRAVRAEARRRAETLAPHEAPEISRP